MSDKPLVSVIVPSYNSGQFVAQAVHSVLAQTYPHVELIVVDDGSTDDTKDRLESFGDLIRYVFQPNQGVSKARNFGLSHAKGDLIAFLDADDRWLPEKLEKQCKCFTDGGNASLVHTDVFRWDPTTDDRSRVPCGRERYTGSCYEQFFWHSRINTSSVLVTRQCLSTVGGFDEAIRGPSAEDMDLWIRIARGHRLAYVDEPLVLYRVHPGNGSLNERRMNEDEFYVFDKAIKSDPALSARLGRSSVRARMTSLAFSAGYSNLQMGDARRARSFFAASLRYSPIAPTVWMQWMATFLPKDVRHALRRMKRTLLDSQSAPGNISEKSAKQP